MSTFVMVLGAFVVGYIAGAVCMAAESSRGGDDDLWHDHRP